MSGYTGPSRVYGVHSGGALTPPDYDAISMLSTVFYTFVIAVALLAPIAKRMGEHYEAGARAFRELCKETRKKE